MVPAPEDPFATGEEALDAALEKARDDLEKLEVLNARIPAAALSAQISRMEKAGAAILQQLMPVIPALWEAEASGKRPGYPQVRHLLSAHGR